MARETRSRPGPRNARPLQAATGPQMQAISDDRRWPAKQAISRLTTGGGAGGSLVKKEQGKVSWSTPMLTELTDADQVQVIRLAIAELEKAA